MSAPPSLILSVDDYEGPTPFSPVVFCTTTATSASFTYYWGDGQYTAPTSTASASHTYTTAGEKNILVTVRDLDTNFWGDNSTTVLAYREYVSAAPPPEGEFVMPSAYRPLDPTEPAFQVKRGSHS